MISTAEPPNRPTKPPGSPERNDSVTARDERDEIQLSANLSIISNGIPAFFVPYKIALSIISGATFPCNSFLKNSSLFI